MRSRLNVRATVGEATWELGFAHLPRKGLFQWGFRFSIVTCSARQTSYEAQSSEHGYYNVPTSLHTDPMAVGGAEPELHPPTAYVFPSPF